MNWFNDISMDIVDDIMRTLKPIKNFPDYSIRNDGTIYSHKFGKLKIVVANTSKSNRYPKVKLYRDGKRYHRSVHRLVAEHFVKLPEKYPGITRSVWRKTPIDVRKILIAQLEVNHIDGDRNNFHYSNLEWMTAEDNINHYHTQIRGS